MVDVTSKSLQSNANRLLQTLATYKEAEDLINIGAYVKGSNRMIDYAVTKIGQVNQFLRQPVEQRVSMVETEAQLEQMFRDFPA